MTAALPAEAAGRPVEIWFTDEARVGQQGTLTRVWAKRGSRPRAPRDRRFDPSSTAPFCKLLKAPDNSRRDGSVALHVLERQSVCGDRLHCWWQRHAGGTQCEAGSDPGR